MNEFVIHGIDKNTGAEKRLLIEAETAAEAEAQANRQGVAVDQVHQVKIPDVGADVDPGANHAPVPQSDSGYFETIEGLPDDIRFNRQNGNARIGSLDKTYNITNIEFEFPKQYKMMCKACATMIGRRTQRINFCPYCRKPLDPFQCFSCWRRADVVVDDRPLCFPHYAASTATQIYEAEGLAMDTDDIYSVMFTNGGQPPEMISATLSEYNVTPDQVDWFMDQMNTLGKGVTCEEEMDRLMASIRARMEDELPRRSHDFRKQEQKVYKSHREGKWTVFAVINLIWFFLNTILSALLSDRPNRRR